MRLLLLAISLFFFTAPVLAEDWIAYGHDKGGTRFSPLTQINRDNVHELELAWQYRTGDEERHPDKIRFAGLHTTPILLPEAAGRSLVLCSAFNRLIALDPATGKERWFFDPEVKAVKMGKRFNCRGISYWQDPVAASTAPCKHRLFMGTTDRRLISLDAKDGQPCAGFGEDGIVDVNPLMAAAPPYAPVDEAQFVSPPALVGDVIVMGATVNTKFNKANAPSGTIRAFDARTGDLLWIFETIPQSDSDPEWHNWTEEGRALTGGANAWSIISVDEERDLVFIPTASPGPDFYGGKRPGDNRYANSLLALRGSTGELVWHYQILHHDVWDMDVPAQPILTEIERDGERVPVVVQLTKQSFVFVFHRETGEPFFPIEERPVPTDGVPGDQLSPTQPFPVRPPPLTQQGITPDDAWGLTTWDKAQCRKMIAESRYGEFYTPPTLQGTVIVPGTAGGSNWGGGAVDPNRDILVTTVSSIPYRIRLVPKSELDPNAPFDPRAGMPGGPPGLLGGTEFALDQGPLLSPFSMPCTAPPWGTLVSVDLKEGKINWTIPLGTLDKLAPVPIPLNFGTPTAGGPILTAGGLVFVGATLDEKFRAFDVENGKELWKIATPTTANATPMTYEVNGRQYVVIAAGGHIFQYRHKTSDYILAYALPE